MTKAKSKKPIPSFANEDEERDFWATHNTDEYFGDDGDYVLIPSPAMIRKQKTVPWLKLLLDKETMARLCALAIERGESHHELGTRWLQERLDQEARSNGGPIDERVDTDGILMIKHRKSAPRRRSVPTRGS